MTMSPPTLRTTGRRGSTRRRSITELIPVVDMCDQLELQDSEGAATGSA
jgi:hypothetical protein